jgi:hypothetical protein
MDRRITIGPHQPSSADSPAREEARGLEPVDLSLHGRRIGLELPGQLGDGFTLFGQKEQPG